MITPGQEQALRNALGTTPLMTTPSKTTQYSQYDPAKMQALKSALATPRQTVSGWESFANTLAQTPQAQAFEGGFGEQIIDPWSAGLSSLAQGFGGAYSARKADEREAANQAREDAIKMAELENEAAKKVITDQIELKNNSKQVEEVNNIKNSLNALYALKERNRQNVAGFDNKFDVKNPDGTINIEKTLEAYKGKNPHGLFGRNWDNPNSFWGWGESRNEADVRSRFKTYKETQLRNIYDTLRGSGAITEQEMQTMAETAKNATNPYELDVALDEFITNIESKYGMQKEPQKTSSGKSF